MTIQLYIKGKKENTEIQCVENGEKGAEHFVWERENFPRSGRPSENRYLNTLVGAMKPWDWRRRTFVLSAVKSVRLEKGKNSSHIGYKAGKSISTAVEKPTAARLGKISPQQKLWLMFFSAWLSRSIPITTWLGTSKQRWRLKDPFPQSSWFHWEWQRP